MKITAGVLIIFWIILIKFPEIIAYLIWWFVIFIGLNILIFSIFIKKKNVKSHVKFWDYKIFRD